MLMIGYNIFLLSWYYNYNSFSSHLLSCESCVRSVLVLQNIFPLLASIPHGRNKVYLSIHSYIIYLYMIHTSNNLSIYLSIHTSIHSSTYLSIYPSIYPFIHPSIYQFIHLSILSSNHQSISIYLSIHPIIVIMTP